MAANRFVRHPRDVSSAVGLRTDSAFSGQTFKQSAKEYEQDTAGHRDDDSAYRVVLIEPVHFLAQQIQNLLFHNRSIYRVVVSVTHFPYVTE